MRRLGKHRRSTLGVCLALAATLTGIAAAESAASGAFERKLTLAECILLAVQNNRDLAAGRLDRIEQRLSLEDAEDEFRPDPSFDGSVESDSRASALSREEAFAFGVSSRVTLRIPTGGTISLSANNRVTTEDTAAQFVILEFVQPLLKGAGTEVGTANLVTARRRERSGVLGFKQTVISLVTRTIYAYRNVIKSMRAVEIAKRSVQRAEDLLEVNRVLIETGRMARQDIVQTEANVAERKLSLTEAEGALNDARLSLIDILDIDSRTLIRPTESLRVDQTIQDINRGVELALRNRPDYLRALLSLENTETALAVADNARKWDLNFTSSAKLGHTGDSFPEAYSRFDDDYHVGLSFKIPLGANVDSRKRAYRRARIALQRSHLQVAELRQSIEIEVRAAVRDVEIKFRRAELARQARELAERKLDIERIKLNSGLTTNFRLVRFEDDLVRSHNNEVGAIIAYLNAVTALDRTRGTTLDTWRIEIDATAEGVENK